MTLLTKLLQAGKRLVPLDEAEGCCDWPQRWIEIMRACWSGDPKGRPTFAVIVQEFETLVTQLAA